VTEQEILLKCYLQMEREILQGFFFLLHYLLSALCARPLWYGRRQADNPFPPKHPANRPGAASLATKIAWPKAKRFFFLIGRCKGLVFLPLLPQDLPKLRTRIIAAIPEIDRDVLHRVWTEMDYRFDVCRVTKDGHTQHLWGMPQKKKTLRVSLFIRR